MTTDLEFTGERYVPELGGEIRLEHVHRYAFCRPYVKGKVVVDAACGEGYGTAMLASYAARVVGIDISDQAIQHASSRYGALGNIEFRAADVAKPGLPTASVDVVVSFETIEHLHAQEQMLAEFARILKPEGLLILSSPDKKTYSDDTGYRNEFHVKELYRDQLSTLIDRHFKRHALLGQRIVGGSSIFSLTEAAKERRPVVLVDDGEAILERSPRLGQAVYFIALATNGPALPSLQPSTALSEHEDPILELKEIAKWASGVHGELVEAQTARASAQAVADAEIASLRHQLHAARQDSAAQQELQQSEWRRARDELVANWAMRVRKIEAELLLQREEAIAARQQCRELEQRLADFQAAAVSREGEWESRLARREQEFRDLESTLASVQSEAARLEEDSRTLRAQLVAERAEAARLEEDSRTLRAQLVAERAEAAVTQDSLKAELKSGASALEALEARRQQEVRDLESTLASLQSEAARREEDSRTLQGQLVAERAEAAGLRRESRALQDELRAVKVEGTSRAEADALRIDAASRRVEELEQAARRQQAEYTATLRAMQDAHDALDTSRAAAHLAHAGELAARIGHLDERLVEAEQRHQLDVERLQSGFQVQTHALHAKWAAEREALVSAQEAELQALRTSFETNALMREVDAQAELGWWRQEVTEARRQLQQLRLSHQRQSEAAARGLAELRDQQVQERAKLLANMGSCLRYLRALNLELGSHLEILRLPVAMRAGVPPEQVASLHSLHEQAHELGRALERVDPTLGLPESVAPPRNVQDLLALDDTTFVKAAYRTVLSREPDRMGEEHYVERLRAGERRLRVLSDLRLSQEGRSKETSLEGLDEALRATRRSRLDWSGRSEVKRLQAALQQHGATPTSPSPTWGSATSHQLARLEESVEQLGRGSALLAEAVPIAVSLGRAPKEFGLDPWACAQELVRSEDAAFVELAYGLIQRRTPTDAEVKREQRRLAEGSSRVQVIELLMREATDGSGSTAAEGAAYRSRAILALGGASPLPLSAHPEVTIVIAAPGRGDRTLRCLQSIRRFLPQLSFEIIVVDDASSDASGPMLSQIPGIRCERMNIPGGLGACFNHGARMARGEWLHFLRNDAEVQEGWLDELRRTFDIFPGTGLAGSKLLQPDATVLSAGRVVWKDGSASDIGADGPADGFDVCHARPVDTCAAVSMLMPRLLFEAVGGFAEEPGMVGAEDRVLALELADRGYRTVLQALSVVTCHEPADLSVPQAATLAQLQSRYAQALEKHCAPETPIDTAAHRLHCGCLLAIEHRLPRPDRDAGSVTVFNMLMAARELGLQVSLVAEADLSEGVSPDIRYIQLLQRSGVRVLTAPHVLNVVDYLEASGAGLDVVLLYRPVVMERYGAVVQQLCPRAKRLYYPHDLHFLRLSRQAEVLGNEELAKAAAIQRPQELEFHRLADCCLLASEAEVSWLADAGLAENARWLPLLLDCTRTANSAAQRKNLLFVGGFHHAPNVHALRLLLEDIMPRVRQLRPEVELMVVGESPPRELVERQDPGVTFLGAVDDLTACLDQARVAVAPLTFGAGAKGKVARPMAAGLPVVATPEAVEGMHLSADVHLLVADLADDFAAKVVRLHDDDGQWQRLSDAGYQQAHQQWGPKAGLGNMASILHGVGISTRQPAFGCRFFHEPVFLPAARVTTHVSTHSTAIAAS